MIKFKKAYKFKIISLVIALLFFCTTIGYAIDLPEQSHLRVSVGIEKQRIEKMLSRLSQPNHEVSLTNGIPLEEAKGKLLNILREKRKSRPSKPLLIAINGMGGSGKRFISKELEKETIKGFENSAIIPGDRIILPDSRRNEEAIFPYNTYHIDEEYKTIVKGIKGEVFILVPFYSIPLRDRFKVSDDYIDKKVREGAKSVLFGRYQLFQADKELVDSFKRYFIKGNSELYIDVDTGDLIEKVFTEDTIFFFDSHISMFFTDLVDLYDATIFVEASKEIRHQRMLEDIKIGKRNPGLAELTEEAIIHRIRTRYDKFSEIITSQQHNADIVITNNEVAYDERWDIYELLPNTFEFSIEGFNIALDFFKTEIYPTVLQKRLLKVAGIKSVEWVDNVLTIFSKTEVVKIHFRDQEINERMGLKDRIFIKNREGDERDIVVKIYEQDERDYRKIFGPIYILGITRNSSHDSSAVLVKDGKVIGAIAEERLVREKHARGSPFPENAIRYLLDAHNISWEDIAHIAVSWDYNWYRDMPHSRSSFDYMNDKLEIPIAKVEKTHRVNTDIFFDELQNMVYRFGSKYIPPITSVDHHKSHLISAWHTSVPFDEPILGIVIDGKGENKAISVWFGYKGKLKKIASSLHTNSLGFLYLATTVFLGYSKNEPGKVMGVAPYGHPGEDVEENRRVENLRKLFDSMVQFDEGTGRFKIDPRIFHVQVHDEQFVTTTFSDYFIKKLEQYDIIPLKPGEGGELLYNEKEKYRPYLNLAYVLQKKVEEIVLQIVKYYFKDHPPEGVNCKNLIMSGGFLLNVSSNGKIVSSGLVDSSENLRVPFAPGDDGTSIGAALSVAQEEYQLDTFHSIESASLGRIYNDAEIKEALDKFGLVESVDYQKVESQELLVKSAVDLLVANKTLAWFQGGSEFGPRTLGNRSILHLLTDPQGNDIVNIIKGRERGKEGDGGRPSALSIIEEAAPDFLENITASPYMTIAFNVREEKKNLIVAGIHPDKRDGTTRPQTVSRRTSPLFWSLLNEVGQRTGVPGLLNTSFNRREPIVETPEQALNTFYYSEGIDVLIVSNYIILRTDNLSHTMSPKIGKPATRSLKDTTDTTKQSLKKLEISL